MDVNFFRVLHNLFHEVRWNEAETLTIAEHDISRHHGRCANPDRHVDAGEHHLANGCRMDAAEIGRHLDRIDSLEVADAAVNHHAGLGGLINIRGQIVADESPALLLSEQVHNDHVAGLEHVDDTLVVVALA